MSVRLVKAGCSEEEVIRYSLREGLGYVSCSLKVTRRMK